MRLPFVIVLFITQFITAQQQTYSKVLTLMGSRFEMSVVADNEKIGKGYINSAVTEIKRIEKLISSWDSKSQTSLINKYAGIKPVAINKELIDLIKRSIQLSKITEGAFDITYASMDKIWKFDGSMKEMPSESQISASVKNIGYQNIIIDDIAQTVFLKHTGMKIGFGAIGKGYAADKAKSLLLNLGVKSGIINASGDLNAWGKKPDNTNWLVGITNPLNTAKVFSWLPIDNQAVVTSGNYEKFVVFNGQRYAHIINPRTGYPTTGVKSVTIFAPKAELADALATSVFVMGVTTGLNFINQLEGVEAIIIDDVDKFYTTNTLKFKTDKQ